MGWIELGFRIDQPDLRGFEFKIFMKNLTQKPTGWIELNPQILMSCQACQDIID